MFVKTASGSPRLSGVDGKKKERGVSDELFFEVVLSTGRRPMPLVVAVLGLVYVLL